MLLAVAALRTRGSEPRKDAPPMRIHEVKLALQQTLPASADPVADRTAAVAAIFRDSDARGLEVLFIQRAEREGDPWSGHMAFPGGRRELADTDLLATAVRETCEEIGIDLTRAAELVGVLEDQEASGRATQKALPTRPFVFELNSDPKLTLNEEVRDVVWTPVLPLVRGEQRTTMNITYKGMPYALPGWDLGGRVVWGLTYRMLSMLLSRVKPPP
jgi:8-oxo-dGTP pyrophosphatase MutT (NUDIX family)